MFATAARRSLTGLVPPKIATPGAVVRTPPPRPTFHHLAPEHH
jgi:hypothetical protein